MGHGHGHGVAAQAGSASSRHLTRLWLAAGLGLVTFITQLVVGLWTSSLALLSDSAHVFTDVLGVLVAVVAILVARRGSDHTDRTFGMYRTEVFAALVNAVLLFAVAGWVLYEAVERIGAPPEVPGLPVTLVALVGLAMNIIAFALLRRGAEESIYVRGAYLEVMADLLGSIGVLISGLLTLVFGWRYADPAIGVAIGLFVLPRAWALGRRAVRILFQHAPEGLDVPALATGLERLPGVAGTHDLHVWTLTSGMEVASVHVVLTPDAQPVDVLATSRELLAERYGIEHATVQVERSGAVPRCHELAW